jgi:hypothetical protein
MDAFGNLSQSGMDALGSLQTPLGLTGSMANFNRHNLRVYSKSSLESMTPILGSNLTSLSTSAWDSQRTSISPLEANTPFGFGSPSPTPAIPSEMAPPPPPTGRDSRRAATKSLYTDIDILKSKAEGLENYLEADTRRVNRDRKLTSKVHAKRKVSADDISSAAPAPAGVEDNMEPTSAPRSSRRKTPSEVPEANRISTHAVTRPARRQAAAPEGNPEGNSDSTATVKRSRRAPRGYTNSMNAERTAEIDARVSSLAASQQSDLVSYSGRAAPASAASSLTRARKAPVLDDSDDDADETTNYKKKFLAASLHARCKKKRMPRSIFPRWASRQVPLDDPLGQVVQVKQH